MNVSLMGRLGLAWKILLDGGYAGRLLAGLKKPEPVTAPAAPVLTAALSRDARSMRRRIADRCVSIAAGDTDPGLCRPPAPQSQDAARLWRRFYFAASREIVDNLDLYLRAQLIRAGLPQSLISASMHC